MPPDMFAKRFFAKNYQFTEEQTEESSLDALKWFPLIEEAEDHAIKIKQRSESRQQGGR
jgi:hypothetical protein